MSRRSRKARYNRKATQPTTKQGQPVEVLDRATTTQTAAKPKPASSSSSSDSSQQSQLAKQNVTPAVLPPMLMGGRQTQATNVNPLPLGAFNFVPRAMRDIDLRDTTRLQAFLPEQLLSLLADIDSGVSLATWNVILLANQEFSFDVKSLDGKKELPEAKALLEELINNRINKDAGGLYNLCCMFFHSAYLQGAISAELVLSDDLQEVIDIVAVAPYTIYFMRDWEQNLVPFQRQILLASGPHSSVSNIDKGLGLGTGNIYLTALQLEALGTANMGMVNDSNYTNYTGGYPFKRLNPITFKYIPVHPEVDGVYGRPPAAPVLQQVVFYQELLRDLRQAVHMSAWGRIHIKVVEEAVMQAATAAVQNDPTGDKKRDFAKQVVADIKTAYSQMQPDDAIVTTDSIQMEALDFSGGTLKVDSIMQIVENLKNQALKQLPILMGNNQGTTESHGTVQFEIYSNGIQSFQQVACELLESLFETALMVYGIQAKVECAFKKIRASARLVDAQSSSIEGQTAAFAVKQGWVTNDEAAMNIAGHPAVSEPKPDPQPQQFGSNQQQGSQQQDQNENNGDNKKPEQLNDAKKKVSGGGQTSPSTKTPDEEEAA